MSLGSLRDTAYAIDSYSLAVFLSSVMSPGQGAAYDAFVDRRTNIYTRSPEVVIVCAYGK